MSYTSKLSRPPGLPVRSSPALNQREEGSFPDLAHFPTTPTSSLATRRSRKMKLSDLTFNSSSPEMPSRPSKKSSSKIGANHSFASPTTPTPASKEKRESGLLGSSLSPRPPSTATKVEIPSRPSKEASSKSTSRYNTQPRTPTHAPRRAGESHSSGLTLDSSSPSSSNVVMTPSSTRFSTPPRSAAYSKSHFSTPSGSSGSIILTPRSSEFSPSQYPSEYSSQHTRSPQTDNANSSTSEPTSTTQPSQRTQVSLPPHPFNKFTLEQLLCVDIMMLKYEKNEVPEALFVPEQHEFFERFEWMPSFEDFCAFAAAYWEDSTFYVGWYPEEHVAKVAGDKH